MIIKETKAADGYQLENNEASFTIGKSGTDMILEVSDIAITNLRTKFTFKKLATYVESCSDETLGTGALPAIPQKYCKVLNLVHMMKQVNCSQVQLVMSLVM